MNGLDALQSVQYATIKGNRIAVVSIEEWESLIEWIETIEDGTIAKQALEQLKQAGGNRKKAGWLAWDEVKNEL